jgi:thymidylate kinase
MKIIVAIEGVDGAGKTTLGLHIQKRCEEHGQRFTLIGRRGSHASGAVGRLTRFLHDECPYLSPQADLHMRLAREYQRAYQAATTPGGLVVLDRFVLSVLALARLNGQDAEAMQPFFKDIAARAHLHATIFVDCPFEIATGRAQERSPGPVTKRSYGEPQLRRLGEIMAADFSSGLLTGQQWRIDNSGTLEAAQQQLDSYLLPYFRLADR